MCCQLITTERLARKMSVRLALALLASGGVAHAHAGQHDRLVAPTASSPTMAVAPVGDRAGPPQRLSHKATSEFATALTVAPVGVEGVERIGPEIETAPERMTFAISAPAAVQPTFSLRLTPQDGRVSKAMQTFAMQHGWKLSWEIDRDFPIRYEAQFDGGVLEIVAQIAHSLQNLDAPIRVKAYHANKVMRVLYATY